jgi:hypothetical protein
MVLFLHGSEGTMSDWKKRCRSRKIGSRKDASIPIKEQLDNAISWGR